MCVIGITWCGRVEYGVEMVGGVLSVVEDVAPNAGGADAGGGWVHLTV